MQLGAISLAFPVFMLIQAIGNVFGNGAPSYISRCLGAKRYEEVERTSGANIGLTRAYLQVIVAFAEEERLVKKVAGIITAKETIACTACRYCVDGCPQKIGIPDFFKLVNDVDKFGRRQLPLAKSYYTHYTTILGMGRAPACIECGQCEQHCPQHLPIIEDLKKVSGLFEG